MKHKHPSGSLGLIFAFQRACFSVPLLLPACDLAPLSPDPLCTYLLCPSERLPAQTFSKEETRLPGKSQHPTFPSGRHGSFLVPFFFFF